jgi:hypothetical protein
VKILHYIIIINKVVTSLPRPILREVPGMSRVGLLGAYSKA